MRPSNDDRHRRHREATSKAMKRVAEARRCPACQRKNAISRRYLETGGPELIKVVRCRWCDYVSESLVGADERGKDMKDRTNDPLMQLAESLPTDDGRNTVGEIRGAAEARLLRHLPVDGTRGLEEVWAKLGFDLGEPGEDGDDLLRPVRSAPEGWRIVSPEDDPRHMVLLDAEGRHRAKMFYKRAAYDRCAMIHLIRRLSVRNAELGMPPKDLGPVDVAIIDHAVAFPLSKVVAHFKGDPADPFRMRAIAEATRWLDEHYPDHQDPTAYWDAVIAGTTYRLEH